MPFTSGTMMRLGKAEARGLACRQQSRRMAYVPSATRTAAAAKAAVTAKSAKIESKAAEPVQAVTGLVFEPFSAVQGELATVNKTQEALESFARMDFHPECEAAINHQINVEYTVSYVYHALFCYFDRDNVALPGLAAYFKAGSVEEREHAELLMEYQNRRGGRVKLAGISMPQMEFGNAEKGDALYAMELALSLEKLNFTNLRQLHAVADKHGDAAFADFVEGALLDEQTEAVKKVSEYVSQLRRVGKGLGVYTFDKELAEAMKAQA